MNISEPIKLLFVVNPGSGKNTADWPTLIEDYYKGRAAEIDILELDQSCSPGSIKKRLQTTKPDRVIAVGGDGTVKLAATCLVGLDVPLGIIPAGSANGMAKELGIPANVEECFDLAMSGVVHQIHLTKINEEICIHLGDIGFNAFVIKKFETSAGRGMWGYIKASWKVLWQHSKMQVEIEVDGKLVKKLAAMVVIANATKYGSGALINPGGKLDDDVFEVIVVKKVSLAEIFKMMVTHVAFNPGKTEIYQAKSLRIKSRRKAHFQVDGEYLGKVNQIKATLMPAALKMIVPAAITG